MRNTNSQDRTRMKRLKTLGEITRYIMANNGPDEEGYGHPRKKRMIYDDISKALIAAQKKGFCKNLKPYHFRSTMYMYRHSWIADEILEKKIDQLLREKYNGDMVDLISNTFAKELQSPLIDSINGRLIKVSMKRVCMSHNNSPFEMVRRYIEIKGWERKFRELKPYHFHTTGNNVFSKRVFAEEVLVKKIDSVLRQKYNGDLIKFIMNASQKELLSPLHDYLAGKPLKVSMKAAGNKIGNRQQSPFLMVSRYIKLKGRGRRKQLMALAKSHIRHYK